jgi:hypothetical protein
VFTQPLTELSTRSRKIVSVGSRARLMDRADNLATICEPMLDILNISQPCGPVMGIPLHFKCAADAVCIV